MLLLLLLLSIAAPMATTSDGIMSTDQAAQLKHMFEQHMQSTLTRKPSSAAQLVQDLAAMGPGRIECIAADRVEPFIELEFGISRDQAVSLRSISKMMASLAVLKLKELGRFDIEAPHGFCSGVPHIFNATITDLLSMNAHGLDGMANAFRVKQNRNNNPHDTLGFPPVCDDLVLNPLSCVESFLCPFYEKQREALNMAGVVNGKQEIDSIPDVTCGGSQQQETKRCARMKARGYCKTRPVMMVVDEGCVCNEACDKADLPLQQPGERWVYSFNNKQVEKQRTQACVYDNYAYTVVDAAVYKQTGRFLEHWVRELVFKPLGMSTSLECDEREVCSAQCLAPPTTNEEWFLGKFQQWRGGSMTKNWIGNAFFGSARDMHKLLQMLLNNGTDVHTGNQVFTKQSIDFLFGTREFKGQRPFGHCMGAQEFGWGVGFCRGRERENSWGGLLFQGNRSREHTQQPGVSMCTSENVHFWASSHGSRFSLARDRNVACYAMLNQPIEHSGRSHFIAHNMSAFIREVFPIW